MRDPALLPPDGRGNRHAAVADLPGGRGGVLGRRDRGAGVQRRGGHAAGGEQPAVDGGRVRLRAGRERVQGGGLAAPGQGAGGAEGVRGSPGGGRDGGAAGAVGAGLQLPRYREHHVQGHQDHGRLDRAGPAGLYQGDWILPHACAGGRADLGAAWGLCGPLVSVGHET